MTVAVNAATVGTNRAAAAAVVAATGANQLAAATNAVTTGAGRMTVAANGAVEQTLTPEQMAEALRKLTENS